MPYIAPCLEYPAGGAVEAAMGNDRQAGIWCDEATWLIERQARNVAKNTIKNPSMRYDGNGSTGSLGK